MQHLSLTKSDWQRERGAIEQEVSLNLSKPIARYFIQQNAYLFAGSPYTHDALGTRDSFDKTDTVRLRHFYETWYQPNNAILLIVGDVEPKKAFPTGRGAIWQNSVACPPRAAILPAT